MFSQKTPAGTGGTMNIQRSAASVFLWGCALFCTHQTLAEDPTAANLENLVFYPSPLPEEIRAGLTATSTSLGFQPRYTGHLMLATNGTSVAGFSAELTETARYEKKIQEIEGTAGPFAPALTQNLLALGQLYQESGQHDQAIIHLDRALQISKTNNGLYSPEQISITEQLLSSYRATGQLQEIENTLEYLVHLHQKYYGSHTPQTASALKGLGEWKLQSFNREIKTGTDTRLVPKNDLFFEYESWNDSLESLYDAQNTFIEAITMLVESTSFSDPGLYELESDLRETYFLNANRERLLNGNDLLDRSRVFTSIKAQRDFMDENRQDFHNGENSWKRVIGYLKQNPEATVEDYTTAMLGLGDWYLMFDEFEKAQQQYQALENLLKQANYDSTAIRQMMTPDVPAPLPEFVDTLISPRRMPEDEVYKGHIDIALTLNRYGRVAEVDILGTSENANADIEARLVSLVRSARFRPSPGKSTTTGARYYYTY
jgi:tetratricopeptide (TPR) repeat protein